MNKPIIEPNLMPPLRGFGGPARRFYKDGTPTKFTEQRKTGDKR